VSEVSAQPTALAGARAPRINAYNPLVPLAIFAAVVVAVGLASTLLPASFHGPGALVIGVALLALAYVWLPKPALLAFALFILLYDTFTRWFGPSIRNFDEAALPVLALLAALKTRPWRNRTWIQPVRDGALIALVLLGVTASLVQGVPPRVWILGLLLMLKGIVFLYIVLWHHFDDRDVRQVTIAVLALGLVVLAGSVVELINVTTFRSVLGLPGAPDARGQLPGLQSFFSFPVLFAWFMGIVAIFLFAYYVILRRWWMLAGALVFGAAMFLSGRRRAIVGLAVALVAGLLTQIRRGVSRRAVIRLWLPVGAAALVLAIIFAPGLQTLWNRTMVEWLQAPPAPAPQDGGPIQYTNGNPRLLLYQTSVDLSVKDFPVGAGLGRFGSPMSRIEYSPVYAEYGLDRIWGLTPAYEAYITDTFWPHILGEIGVFGLGAYIVFLGALGVALWQGTRRVSAPILLAFCLGAWMVFINALVESVASSMFESPPRIYLVFGAIAVALVLSRGASRIVTSTVAEPNRAPGAEPAERPADGPAEEPASSA